MTLRFLAQNCTFLQNAADSIHLKNVVCCNTRFSQLIVHKMAGEGYLKLIAGYREGIVLLYFLKQTYLLGDTLSSYGQVIF